MLPWRWRDWLESMVVIWAPFYLGLESGAFIPESRVVSTVLIDRSDKLSLMWVSRKGLWVNDEKDVEYVASRYSSWTRTHCWILMRITTFRNHPWFANRMSFCPWNDARYETSNWCEGTERWRLKYICKCMCFKLAFGRIGQDSPRIKVKSGSKSAAPPPPSTYIPPR